MDDYTKSKRKIERRNERNRLRREAGVCVGCADIPVPGLVVCESCRLKRYRVKKNYNGTQKQRDYETQRRLKRLAAGICKSCSNVVAPGKTYCQSHIMAHRKYNQEPFEIILRHYGQICVCCGEQRRAFLTIDHVNGDGNVHRRKVAGSNKSHRHVQRDIIEAGFPSFYRILCLNCNWSRGVHGYCPHENERKTIVINSEVAIECIAACLS